MSRLTRVSAVSKIRPVKKTLPVTLGALMFVVGLVWTLQGLGYLEGSPMTGVEIWAVIGPLLAGFGVALAIVGLRGPRS
jgi:hypothetical protein